MDRLSAQCRTPQLNLTTVDHTGALSFTSSQALLPHTFSSRLSLKALGFASGLARGLVQAAPAP